MTTAQHVALGAALALLLVASSGVSWLLGRRAGRNGVNFPVKVQTDTLIICRDSATKNLPRTGDGLDSTQLYSRVLPSSFSRLPKCSRTRIGIRSSLPQPGRLVSAPSEVKVSRVWYFGRQYTIQDYPTDYPSCFHFCGLSAEGFRDFSEKPQRPDDEQESASALSCSSASHDNSHLSFLLESGCARYNDASNIRRCQSGVPREKASAPALDWRLRKDPRSRLSASKFRLMTS